MSELTKLFVTLGLDSSGFEKGLKKITPALSTIGKSMIGMGAAITGPMLLLTNQAAKVGDEIAKMAQKTGMSTESLSEMKYIADLSGASLDDIGRSMKNMQVNLTEMSKDSVAALQALQIESSNFKQLKPEDQFWEIMKALDGIEDAALKTTLATELFGKSGVELLPILADGEEGIAKMKKEARDLNLVFSKESAEAAERFEDSKERMTKSLTGLGNEIGQTLMPILVKFFDKATEIVGKITAWAEANPQLVKTLAAIGGALILGGGILLGLAQLNKAIQAINASLILLHALSGPAGWAVLAAIGGIAAGYGINELLKKLEGGAPQYANDMVRYNDEWITREEYNRRSGAGGHGQGIPGLALGGLVTTPTLAMVGEGGPEVVMPLSRLGGAGGGTVINVTVQGSVISERELWDIVQRQGIRYKGRNTVTGL